MALDQKITLTLDMNELNTVMAGIGKLPYEQAFLTVESIRKQAGPQIQQQTADGDASGAGAMGQG
jgi:hypothetical protein